MRSSARTWDADRRLDALIVWTFVTGGLAPILPRLTALPGLELIPYLNFLLFLPAAIVGGLRYLANPRSFRAGPMIAIIAVMVVGLLWVEATERGKGVVELALVAIALPLAVLIQRRREWLMGVFAYILASTAAAIYLFYDWLGQSERTGLTVDRYGGLYDERATRLTDQNVTATHLAFGVLLIAMLWLAPTPGTVERRWRAICTACLPVLLIGLVLSGSRGGVLSLLGAVTVLAAFTAFRRTLPLRTNVLGGLGLALVAALLLFAPNPVSHRLAPESGSANVTETADAPAVAGYRDRINRSDTRSFGGRTATWRAALEASGSSPRMLLVGAGTGGADHAIAAANPDLIIARVGEHGVIRANAHSSYFYWLVSYGIVGMVIGAAAVAVMVAYAVYNDWHRTYGGGVAMLAFFLLTSVTLIANRLEITSVIVSALTLGYVLSTCGRDAEPGKLRFRRPAIPWGAR